MGENRPKKCMMVHLYKDKPYIYNFDYKNYYNKLPNITEENKSFRNRFKNIKMLLGSLVSFAHYENIPIKAEVKTITYEEVADVDVDKVMKYIDDDNFEYISHERGIVQLKRLKPSKCPTCNKKHMKENAFIFVKDKQVYFNCRRVKKNSLLGSIQSTL